MKMYIVIIMLAMLSATAFSQDTKQRQADFNLENNDPVAYFEQNKAIQGKNGLAATYEGVTYYFTSEANKELFSKNPAGYEPEYGGWCAYAMGSAGEKVGIDPKTFKIVDGKLFLFYNAFFNNTLKSWNKDEKNLRVKADANWKRLTLK